MLNIKFILAALAAVTIGLMGIQAEAHSVVFEGEISGAVIDAATGEALSGVEVRIEENGESAETNEDGEFSLDNLEPGIYTLFIEEEGYEEWSQTIEVTEDGTDVEIALQPAY